jgi:hypothetical protein
MMRLRGVVVGVLFLVLASINPLHAQQFSSVSGVVSDKNGDTITGASVTLDNAGLGVHAITTTNEIGYYQFLRLTPADGYELTFAKDGFKSLVINRLSFGVSAAETRNATLELGQITTKIEVTAAGEGSLNTTDASVGNVITERSVTELPIQTRLNPTLLMQLQAGVNDSGSITGARSDQGNITLDGVDLNDEAGQFAFSPVVDISVDALQEVRTVTAGETADFGRSSGGLISLATKGGTNDFHGNLREYNRNTLFEANDWFSNRAGVPRSPLIRNQFGGNLGGPIKKDKLFFFFDYEGLRQTAGIRTERAVPTPQFRSGMLGYVNSSSANCSGASRLNNAPSCITFLSATDVAALDPQGTGENTALLAFINQRYPSTINDPTFGDGINTEGFIFNAPAKETENVYTTRIDYTFSQHHKFFLRGNVQRTGVDDSFNTSIEQFPGDAHPASRDFFGNYSGALGWVWTVSPNTSNQFTGSLTRQVLRFPSLVPTTFPDALGFSPDISSPFHGFSSQSRNVPVPEFQDAVTKTMGRHTLNFGGDMKFIRQISALTNDFVFPTIGLGGQIQSLVPSLRPGDINADPAAVSDYDNFFPFLLGRYASVFTNFNYDKSGNVVPEGAGKSRYFNYNEFELYLQDSWKVRSNLTVTYGLRWDLHTVPYEINGFQSTPSVNFGTYFQDRVAAAAQGLSGNNAAPLVTYTLGGSANNGRGYYNPDYKDFGPRIGVAYNPSFKSGLLASIFGDRKSTVRLGGAILYDRIAGGASFFLDQNTFLFDSSNNLSLGVAGDPVTSLATDPRFTNINALLPGLPAPSVKSPNTPNLDASGNPVGTFNGGFPAFAQFDHNAKNPYAIVINAGFQRELPGNLFLEVNYVGRLGRRLLALGDTAQIVNFKDATSGQLLKPAFAQLQSELPTLVQQFNSGAPVLNLPAVPWFENQINGALAVKAPGLTCPVIAQIIGDPAVSNCTTLTAFQFFQLASKGDLSDTIQSLAGFGGLGIINPNVGLPAQTSANAYIGNYASSNYNGLLISLRKRISNNLQFDFNYTFSHSIDNVSDVTNNFPGFTANGSGLICDLTNLRTCRASSDFDARHAINLHYLYDLPFGRGQLIGHDAPKWVDTIVGGFTWSGILSWRAGFPFTINTGAFPTDFTLDGPAELVGPISALHGSIHTDSAGNLQFFANPTSALAALGFTTGGAVGNRNVATGPGFFTMDMGISKSIKAPWAERQKLVLRLDSFNVFNHPSFSTPATNTLSNTSVFGFITSTASAPRVLQVALRYEF